MFRKYKNRKLLEEKYKNSLDVSCEIPSVKQFVVEQEFILNQILEQYRLDALEHNLDPFIQIREDLQHILREASLKAMSATGIVRE